jgi:hypothetical protein
VIVAWEMRAGAVLVCLAYPWARYSIGLQRRAARIMRRSVGYSAEVVTAHKIARVFGTAFLTIMGLISFVVGLTAVISH